MIINIRPGTFGGLLCNGDMVALLNVFEHLRMLNGNEQLKFFMMPGTISTSDYCVKFFEYLKTATDYFSEEPSDQLLSWNKVNLWDYRAISGDLVKINNDIPMKKKIVIFPVFDAPYNMYRNWPPVILQKIIDDYQTNNEFEKILCVKDIPNGIDLKGFTISTDFIANINHILECHTFIGGETGTSIFASALDRPPENLLYFYSNRALLHTVPFHSLNGKGRIINYWLDCEGTTWR